MDNEPFFAPTDASPGTSPRRSMERNERQAYQSMSDSAVGRNLPVQPRAMGGGGFRRVTRSATFFVVTCFAVGFAVVLWTVEIAVRLAKLAS